MIPSIPRTAPAVAAMKPKRMTAANITRGPIVQPWFILLYGEPKLGKTTFASQAPSPLLLDLDNGSKDLDVARYPKPNSFSDVREALEDAARNGIANGFKTLIVDPLAHLEPLIALDVTDGKLVNTKTWGGGFQAYDNAIRDRVRVFFTDIERVHTAGMNVMLIGHSKVKKFEDPEGPSYDKYVLDVESKQLAGSATQLVQAILFCKKEAYGKVDPSTKKAKAAGAGIHMLYTIGTPAYQAGNRWSLPHAMPLSWPAFASAMANGAQRRVELLAEIEAGLVAIADEKVTALVRGWLKEGQDPAAVKNAVAAKLEELVQAAAAEETPAEDAGQPTEETTS